MRVDVGEAVWGPNLFIPFGPIDSETITNAMKHAFPEGRRGWIEVFLRDDGTGNKRLHIEDSGVGMAKKRRDGALGPKLAETLAKQIRGKVDTQSEPDCGVRVVVSFLDRQVTYAVNKATGAENNPQLARQIAEAMMEVSPQAKAESLYADRIYALAGYRNPNRGQPPAQQPVQQQAQTAAGPRTTGSPS